jgi:hypothetical protein
MGSQRGRLKECLFSMAFDPAQGVRLRVTVVKMYNTFFCIWEGAAWYPALLYAVFTGTLYCNVLFCAVLYYLS